MIYISTFACSVSSVIIVYSPFSASAFYSVFSGMFFYSDFLSSNCIDGADIATLIGSVYTDISYITMLFIRSNA